MNVEEIKQIFYQRMPEFEIHAILDVKGHPVIIASPTGVDVDEWLDGYFVVADNEVLGYSPYDDIKAVQKAYEHPLYLKGSSELKHHGVKGMHWGIINEDKLLGLFKRGIQDPLKNASKMLQTSSDKLRTAASDFLSQARQNSVQNPMVKQFKEQLSNKVKTATAPYKDAADYIKSTPQMKSILNGLKAQPRDSSGDNFKMSLNDVLKVGNAKKREQGWKDGKGFGDAGGWSNNCPCCTLATELRKRGINVNPSPRYSGYMAENIRTVYRGEKIVDFNSDNISEVAKKYLVPNSHGSIDGYYKSGGGHIFNYSVDDKGNVQFEDAQSGNVYHSVEEMNKHYDFARGSFADLTNASIDIDRAYRLGMIESVQTDVDKWKIEEYRKENRTALQTIAYMLLGNDPPKASKNFRNFSDFLIQIQADMDFAAGQAVQKETNYNQVDKSDVFSKIENDYREYFKSKLSGGNPSKKVSVKGVKELINMIQNKETPEVSSKHREDRKTIEKIDSISNAYSRKYMHEFLREINLIDKQVKSIDSEMEAIEKAYKPGKLLTNGDLAELRKKKEYRDLIKKKNKLTKKKKELNEQKKKKLDEKKKEVRNKKR